MSNETNHGTLPELSNKHLGLGTDATAFAKNMASRKEALEFFEKYPTEMTLDNLIESGLPVYVRTNHADARPSRCSVDFTINGHKETVSIPNMSVPFLLNERMRASDIAGSGSLRDYLRKERLVLVHPVQAEKERGSERGQRELARFRGEANTSPIHQPPKVTPRATDADVSDRMKQFVITYEDADVSNRVAVLDSIFASAKAFNRADVVYLQDHTKNDNQAQETVADMFMLIEARPGSGKVDSRS
jgi:hypothetical protein